MPIAPDLAGSQDFKRSPYGSLKMKKVMFAVVSVAFAVSAVAAESDQLVSGKVKRDASGRMQLEPMKHSDFAHRAPLPEATALASEQSKWGTSRPGTVKRGASGRMQLEPLKASDFARRPSPPKVAAPESEQRMEISWQGKTVKRDASGRMQLEPMKASDFTHRDAGSK